MTKDSVTRVSDRSVGLDVVRKKIKSIGGCIDLYSVPGKGMGVSLYIPYRVMVIDALIARLWATA